MESPQPSQWGPALWMILHASAERFGIHRGLIGEEERLWTTLLQRLRFSLPCPACQKHYNEFYSKNQVHYTKEGLTSWLYELHQCVNQRTNKIGISLEECHEQYSIPFCFSHHFNIFRQQLGLALRIRAPLKRDDLQGTLRILEAIRRFYDFF
jgi:hypothetical protein